MSGRPLRLGLLALLVLVVAAVGLFAWRTAGRAPTGPPVLTAAPNPVPAGSGLGSTTISWSTGDGSVGQVYVSEDGGPEALVTQGQGGSEQANWIRAGTTYEFRLYASRDRAKRLAAVTVTGQ
jgi:hypothetical protein